MKRKLIFLSFVAICVFSGVRGDLVMEMDGYQIEPYASYSASAHCERLVCDDQGNLYISHSLGNLWKVTPDHSVIHLATYSNGQIWDIVWGGDSVYGDYLYATVGSNDSSGEKVIQINSVTGEYSTFSTLGTYYNSTIGIDRTGRYGELMYVGESSHDTYWSVSTSGNSQLFSDWPGTVGFCTPYGITFDTAGEYGKYMYLARGTAEPQNSWASGIFLMDNEGRAARFSDIESSGHIEFSPESSAFGYYLFSDGFDVIGGTRRIWRIDETGETSPFIYSSTFSPQFCFSPDGSMYLAQYQWSNNTVTISKVTAVPEPFTVLVMLSGSSVLLRRRRQR